MNESFDVKWFERLKGVNAQITQHFKVGNFEDAKKEFENGDADEPTFILPKLFDDNHFDKVKSLKKLQVDIRNCKDTHQAVKRLYDAKIVEKLNQFELLRIMRLQFINNDQTDQLVQLTEQLYGMPKKPVFDHLVNFLLKTLEEMVGNVTELQEYKNIKKILGSARISEITSMKVIHRNDFGNKIYTDARKVRLLMMKELENIGLDNWKVQISVSEVGSFLVWPQTKRVIVPSSKMLKARKGERVLTETNLSAVISHEILTHAVRAENGESSKLQLLGVGLDGYWFGEEGLATYREQMITGANDYANQNMYFAIGLAYGLDRGGAHRTFREVYTILSDYFFVFGRLTKKHAKAKSFTACERIFKGATGKNTSFVLTRDIAYREGNIVVHKLLQNTDIDNNDLDIGKFDPTRRSHVLSLVELGILPKKPWIEIF